ncbi:MAG: carbamoyltransferase HypF, partial [Pseudomonadota bacterium]|nr:carbamoyltransferase HypF [Pseudomonadota bacterium]
MNAPAPAIEGLSACRIVMSGRVQGVGFRPFVYRIALAHGVAGWVRNETGKVVILAEGAPTALEAFARALLVEAPPLAKPQLESRAETVPQGAQGFHILKSAEAAEADIHLPPDLFCCPDCVAELHDRAARRHAYAFTNCTQCGPRYTIIESLPYDRPHTSMAGFALCPACRAEYENPLDRRFHAQPLACPECGPQLSFVLGGEERATGAAALAATLDVLRAGGVVAAKGVGGYHLLCDAASDAAIAKLRARKHRPHKPLAVMLPFAGADGLDSVRRHAVPATEEADAIRDPARPIVLVRKRADATLGKGLAPGLGELGVFLPYSPLHVLLLEGFGAPLVATSGNISGEPVLTDEGQAQARLSGIADAFLHHNRPIVRPADDSVVRIIGGRPRPIRLGRGIAPLEIDLPSPLAEPTLAVGGHMKGAIALGWGKRAVVSPHIGELDSVRSLEVFAQVINDLQRLYRVEARRVICDAHPRYASTRWAKACSLPVIAVQHHAAHAAALAGEYPDVRRWLVFAWDGVGLGEDSELWGGEAFCGAPGGWR